MSACGSIKWSRNAAGRPYEVTACTLDVGHAGNHWSAGQGFGWSYTMDPMPIESGPMAAPTKRTDLAHALLEDDYTSTPVIHHRGCYICNDPEFAQMGLPLCRVCPRCEGHIAADDTTCDDCGLDEVDEHFGGHTVQEVLEWIDRAPEVMVLKLSYNMGGYGEQNRREILAGDYSHVSPEDVEIFKQALGQT